MLWTSQVGAGGGSQEAEGGDDGEQFLAGHVELRGWWRRTIDACNLGRLTYRNRPFLYHEVLFLYQNCRFFTIFLAFSTLRPHL